MAINSPSFVRENVRPLDCIQYDIESRDRSLIM